MGDYFLVIGTILLLILPFLIMSSLGLLEPKPKDFFKETKEMIAYYLGSVISCFMDRTYFDRIIKKKVIYLKNPNQQSLTNAEQKRLLTLGILSSCQNLCYIDSLTTGIKPFKLALMMKELGVFDSQSFEVLLQRELKNPFSREYAEFIGHSECNNKTFKEASKALSNNLIQDFERSLNEDDSLTSKQKKQYVKNFSNKRKEIDEIKLYYFSVRKDVSKSLVKEGVITSFDDLEKISPLAWDVDRAIFYIRVGFDLGYISEEEAWLYMLSLNEQCLEVYDSWQDYFNGYQIGKAFYGGYYFEHSLGIDYIKDVLSNVESPIKIMKFKYLIQKKEVL